MGREITSCYWDVVLLGTFHQESWALTLGPGSRLWPYPDLRHRDSSMRVATRDRPQGARWLSRNAGQTRRLGGVARAPPLSRGRCRVSGR